MPFRHVFLLPVILAWAGAALAEHIELRLVPHGYAAPNASATLTIRPLRHGNTPGAVPPVFESSLSVSSTANVSLPRGEWVLEAESDAYWHQRQYFVTEGSDNDRHIDVPLWRSGIITSTARMGDGSPLKEVTVRFVSVGSGAGVDYLDGRSVCSVSGNRLRCRIAEGIFDLRVRCDGCIAHYLSEQRVIAGTETAVSDMIFEKGASIVGKIALAPHLNISMEVVRVRAAASGTDRPPAASLTSTPNARGFFHIDGVPPGQYTVTATGPAGSRSVPTGVMVRGTAGVELLHPLEIDRPKTLTIDFLPLLDPQQKPWLVTIYRRITSQRVEPASQSPANDKGQWTSQLHPGKYQIGISSSDGATWEMRDIDFAADERLAVALLQRTVRGSVFLGEKPLSAKLVFGGEFGSRKFVAVSDSEGKFEVLLPSGSDAQEWPVTIDAEKPRVKRDLTVGLPSDPAAELKITLPLTIILGNVVDIKGLPVSNAQISLSSAAGTITQTNVADNGSFAIHGVERGKYRLQAEGFLTQSDEISVVVPDDGATEEVTLVVKPVRKVIGRVISDTGPVVGAGVMVRATDAPALYTISVQTDERGVFSTVAPPSAQQADIFVAAPGFSFKAFHAALPNGPMALPVEQTGGELIARWPAGRGGVVLVHKGAIIFPSQLTSGWGSRLQSDKDAETLFTSPLEPGTYALCVFAEGTDKIRSALAGVATDPRCVNAFLPPYGSATLDLTAAPQP